MIDFTQVLLTLVVGSLTVMLLLVGFQVYKILKELQISISKMNKILDDTGVMTESISKPMQAASNLLLGIKSHSWLLTLARVLRKSKDRIEEEKE